MILVFNSTLKRWNVGSSRKITNAHRDASLARFEVHRIGRGWLLRRLSRGKNSLLCDAGCSYRIPALHFITLLLVYLSRVTTVYQVGTQRRSLVRACCRCHLYTGNQAPRLRLRSKDRRMENLSPDPILNQIIARINRQLRHLLLAEGRGGYGGMCSTLFGLISLVWNILK